MNKQIIKKIKRYFALYLLLVLGSVSLILAILMYLLYEKAIHYYQVDLLSQHYFYDIYYRYSWIINTCLLSFVSIIVLIFFINAYVEAIAYLQALLENKRDKKPWIFTLIPAFNDLEAQIMHYLTLFDEYKEARNEASDYQNEMLMYLAHDLRTPLTSLIGYMNTVIDYHLEGEAQNKALDVSIDKGKRLNQLIDDFSQILTYDEQQAMVFTKFDIGRLIQSQVHGFDPILQQKGFKVELDVQPYLLIEADYDQILRLIDNLMRNAINYALKNSTIFITAKQMGNDIYLSFANDSEILNEEQLSHMFDKFYRGEVARSSASGGAGLGLAICKAIVDAYNGVISVKQVKQQIIFEIQLKGTKHG